MKLSVITLSWDNLDYTKAFVKSIRQNTSLPYELIIVDNGSESQTQKWIEENADKSLLFSENPRVRKPLPGGACSVLKYFEIKINSDEEKEVVSDCMDLGEYYKVRTRDGIIEHLTKIHESDSNGNGSSSSGDVTDEIAGMMNKAESSLNFA